MKYISFIVNKAYQENRIFDKNDPTRLKYYLLKQEFLKYGYELNTCDYFKTKKSLINLYMDIPNNFSSTVENTKNYVLLIESPLVMHNNFNKKYHHYFNKIFTWSDQLTTDHKKYIKLHYAFKFPDHIPMDLSIKTKLCVLIISNKSSSAKNELYSKRKEFIRWFENHYLNDFDLYGRGWNEYHFTEPRYIRILNKITFIKKFATQYFAEIFPSYKGSVDNKYKVMQAYKFSIAYENIKDESGYITEKIFDSFFSGSIPIYLGADNITTYIPKNCFIDKRDFKSYELLYNFIVKMSDDDYLNYLKNIDKFLKSDNAKVFKIEHFAKTIVNEILWDLNDK